ncbi:MAG: hypothetical protein ACKVS6_16615 [Planctomycetota bacterium]
MPQSRFRLDQLEIPDILPGFSLRRYEPGDEIKILETFNRVFAQGNPYFEPRTPARWKWQYSDNPAGGQIVVAVHDETQAIVAQYAAVPRKFRAPGREGIAAEAVDSFVDAKFRAALRRPGLFVVTVNRWTKEFCGDGGDFFFYGLPIETAARIGGAFLDYQCVETTLALEKNIEMPRPFGGPAMPAVSEITYFDERFDKLWTSLAPELGMANIRSGEYLRWRYLMHPEFRYRIAAVGNSSEIIGYMITRRGVFDDRSDQLIVDFLVARGDLDTMRTLLKWAADRGREEGAAQLSCMLPAATPWFADLQRLGFFTRPTKYEWTVSHNKRPFETHNLRKEWFYTLGDTDLV